MHEVEMANQAPTYRVNYVGSQGVVTVNNGSGNPGSGCGQVNQTPAVRHVTVTTAYHYSDCPSHVSM